MGIDCNGPNDASRGRDRRVGQERLRERIAIGGKLTEIGQGDFPDSWIRVAQCRLAGSPINKTLEKGAGFGQIRGGKPTDPAASNDGFEEVDIVSVLIAVGLILADGEIEWIR